MHFSFTWFLCIMMLYYLAGGSWEDGTTSTTNKFAYSHKITALLFVYSSSLISFLWKWCFREMHTWLFEIIDPSWEEDDVVWLCRPSCFLLFVPSGNYSSSNENCDQNYYYRFTLFHPLFFPLPSPSSFHPWLETLKWKSPLFISPEFGGNFYVERLHSSDAAAVSENPFFCFMSSSLFVWTDVQMMVTWNPFPNILLILIWTLGERTNCIFLMCPMQMSKILWVILIS